jgi:nitroimidazol reductase NimA-like FMN-containing flavoprotein (pyridoxamine 5'-phosphate oxidase superfamily)
MKRTEPIFRELDQHERDNLLSRNHVGRIAFSLHNRVDIEPISYIHAGDWLFGRTSEGTKLEALSHQPWVAFEVDEVSGPFDWQSVVIHGTFYRLLKEGSPSQLATYARGLEALRRLSPTAFAAGDPAPYRTVLFGIHIDTMSGRAASTKE